MLLKKIILSLSINLAIILALPFAAFAGQPAGVKPAGWADLPYDRAFGAAAMQGPPVKAEVRDVVQGRPAVFTAVVKNTGLWELPAAVCLSVRDSGGREVYAGEKSSLLQGGAQKSSSLSWPTKCLSPGAYTALYRVKLGGGLSTGTVSFKVTDSLFSGFIVILAAVLIFVVVLTFIVLCRRR